LSRKDHIEDWALQIGWRETETTLDELYYVFEDFDQRRYKGRHAIVFCPKPEHIEKVDPNR